MKEKYQIKQEIIDMMNSGVIYNPNDEEIVPTQQKYISLVNKYNKTKNNKRGLNKRVKLLKQMLGDMGDNVYFEMPIHANFGFRHVHVGSNVYANFNLTCVDDGNIYIGDNTLIGPNVTLITALHPISPKYRNMALQYNKDIHIGKNCWFGSNVTVLPGVNIGDNTIIGAGSLVTKDIPANVVAFGSPCKVVRTITPEDDIYYDHGKLIKDNIYLKENK